ncbi:hypothetical protein HRbin14_02005 [bacterium HR14]|nr:hypothetical protein HRbin14_02005 [bacterium HR14]
MLPAHIQPQAVHNRECQRYFDLQARTLTLLRLDGDGAAEAFHIAFDDIHPDAAPRQVAHLLGCGEPGLEDEVQQRFAAGLVMLREPAELNRLLAHALEVNPASVVAHFNIDAPLCLIGAEGERARFGLARTPPLFGRLDAVVNRVPNQVGERIAERFQKRAV